MAINFGEIGAGAYSGVTQGEEIAWRAFQAQQQRKESARLERQTAIAEAENTRKQQLFDLDMPVRQLTSDNQLASMKDAAAMKKQREEARVSSDFIDRNMPNSSLSLAGVPGMDPASFATHAAAASGTLIDRGQPEPRPAPGPVTAPPAAVRAAPAAPASTGQQSAFGPTADQLAAEYQANNPPPPTALQIAEQNLRRPAGGGGGPAGATGGGGPIAGASPELPTYQPNERRLLHQLITEIPGLTGSSIARQRELYAKLGGEAINGPYRGSTQQNLWLRGQIVNNTYQQALQEQGGSGPAEAAPSSSVGGATAGTPGASAPAAAAELAPVSDGSSEGLVNLNPAPGTAPAQAPPAPAAEAGRAIEIPDSVMRQNLYRGMLEQKQKFEQDQQEWEQQRQQAEQDDFVSRNPIYAMRITPDGIIYDVQSRDEAIKQHYEAVLKAQEYNYQMTLTDSLLNDMGMVPTGATRNARGQLTFRYKNPQTNEEIDFTNDEVNMLEGVWQESLRGDDVTGRPAGHISAEIYQMLSPILKRVPNLMAWRRNQNGEFLADGNGNPIPDTDPTGRYYRLSDDAWDIFAADWRRDEEKNQRQVSSAISAGLGRYRDQQPPDSVLQQMARQHNAAFPNDPWTEDDLLQQWNGMVISTEERQAMDQAKRNATYQRQVEMMQLRESMRDENVVQQYSFQRSMQDLRTAGRASSAVARSRSGRPAVNYDEYYRTRENIEALIGRVDHYANVDENGNWDGTISDQAPIFLQETWQNPEIKRALMRYINRDGRRQSMATANPGNAVVLDEVRAALARNLPNSVFNATAGRGAGAAAPPAADLEAAAEAAMRGR